MSIKSSKKLLPVESSRKLIPTTVYDISDELDRRLHRLRLICVHVFLFPFAATESTRCWWEPWKKYSILKRPYTAVESKFSLHSIPFHSSPPPTYLSSSSRMEKIYDVHDNDASVKEKLSVLREEKIDRSLSNESAFSKNAEEDNLADRSPVSKRLNGIVRERERNKH